MVGTYSTRAVNVLLSKSGYYVALDSPVNLTPGLRQIAMHSYAHQWYGKTVMNPNDSPLGHRFSFERMGGLSFFPSPSPWPYRTLLVQSIAVSELSLLEPVTVGEVAAELQRQTQALAVKTYRKVNQIVDSSVQFVGNVTSSVVEKTQGFFDSIGITSADLVTGPSLRIELKNTPGNGGSFAGKASSDAGGTTTILPAYAWFTVSIPPGAVSMSFDFRLSGDGSNDCLLFGINGTNQFALEARFIPPDIEHNSGVIDVSAIAGMQAEFFFGLAGGTSTNATMTVDGIRFYALESPVVAVQKAGGRFALSWPLSASDYVMESAPTLGFSSVWTVVTNTPVALDFRYSLTNDFDGHSMFFRLRKP